MTNKEIDKLGKMISQSKGQLSSEYVDELQSFRKTFQKPIATVYSFVLKAANNIDKRCIVTYRIKRIDTIIEKLRRFSNNENGSMALSRMWDIAGCRCIINSTDENKLYELVDVIKQEYGEDCKINDYIVSPKESGYKSIHLYVKDKDSGKRVEIQIRNKIQHNWATLVEIIDLLYNKSIKEGKNGGPLEKFLKLYANTDQFGSKDLSKLFRIGRRQRIFEKMTDAFTCNYVNIKQQWLKQKNQGSYFVIMATKDGSSIESFETFESAEEEYYNKYVNHKEANIVLTYIVNPSFEEINMAYSNYILAMHSFFDDYRKLLANHIIEAVNNNRYFQFRADFLIYRRNVRSYIKNLVIEIGRIDQCDKNRDVQYSQLNKWKHEITDRIENWRQETSSFMKRLRIASDEKNMFKWLIRVEIKRMQRDIEKVIL